MEKVTDYSEITRRLDSYLGTNLTGEEIATTEGFKKIANALRTKQCNNADLEFLKIDLSAFEKLVRDNGCREIVFSNLLTPAVNDFLTKMPKVTSGNQYNPCDCLPDDHCAREYPYSF